MPKLIHASISPTAKAYILATSEQRIPPAAAHKQGNKVRGLQVAISFFGTTGWKGYDWSEVNVEGQLQYCAIRQLTYAQEVALVHSSTEPERFFVLTTSYQKTYEIEEFSDSEACIEALFKQYKRLN